MKRYLWALLLFTLGFLALVAGVNAVVDPYGIHRLADLPGVNQSKPTIGEHGPAYKAYQVARVQPRGLILGNSRAESGFDPQHPAWPQDARPVFNLALRGTGSDVALSYFRHTLELARAAGQPAPKLVVLGVDFIDFFTEQAKLDASQPPLPRVDLRTLTDRVQSLLTLGALLDSAATVWAQPDTYSAHLTAQGFNPMRNYEALATREGYHALFAQKGEVYARNFANLASIQPPPVQARAQAFADLAAVMAECASLGIELRLVIYPYHAQFLEAIRLAGLWPAFEAWKLALVAQVEAAATASNRPAVPIFDFNLYNQWTTERVPSSADKGTAVVSFWEAGHFKKELGDALLQRVLGPATPDDQLGQRLTSANVQSSLRALREGSAQYQVSAAAAVALLSQQAQSARLRVQRQLAQEQKRAGPPKH
jgi:hypothetical protein